MIFIATKQKLSFLENSLFETYRVFDYTHHREREFLRPLITLIFYCITLSPVLEMWLNLAEPLSPTNCNYSWKCKKNSFSLIGTFE